MLELGCECKLADKLRREQAEAQQAMDSNLKQCPGLLHLPS